MTILASVACMKLDRELEQMNKAVSSSQAKLIAPYVVEKLKQICSLQDAFADIIIRTQRTLNDCCKIVINNLKNKQYASDLEVYRKALQFYLPDADIDFRMVITLNQLPDDSYVNQKSEPKSETKSKKASKASPKKASKKASGVQVEPAEETSAKSAPAEEAPVKPEEPKCTQVQLSLI